MNSTSIHIIRCGEKTRIAYVYDMRISMHVCAFFCTHLIIYVLVLSGCAHQYTHTHIHTYTHTHIHTYTHTHIHTYTHTHIHNHTSRQRSEGKPLTSLYPHTRLPHPPTHPASLYPRHARSNLKFVQTDALIFKVQRICEFFFSFV